MVLWALLLGLLLVSPPAKAELERVEHAAKADGSLSFLVVGDWGRKGLYNQSQDPAFHQSFSDIYTAPSLQKQWYIVLGNHDYRGNVEAQSSPMLRKMDTRWLCLRSFIPNAGPQMAEISFVDTTPFVSNYFIDPKDHCL
ncbi:hypothetical protein Goshw_005339 [Gossypium schwendimanii]|uniref:Calcineurin-like phosphoesterase domain-containing protein n=1 Tax=Gossypium schwendimanii TaxID=34291 RepID=A0A7J9L7V4_GOSSC|nr:hypothetical protein [Gossypium schwendimanii]